MAALHAYLVEQLARVPGRGRVVEAIRYALSRWEALSLYLDDGRLESKRGLDPTFSPLA